MRFFVKHITVIFFCAFSLATGQAQRQYPHSTELPTDVVWMREIYRTLDLTQETNGALYYPIEPQGDKLNLFTTMFRLLAQKKIPAYEYQLDGTERFQADCEISFRDILDRFQIYYEQKKVANRRDSILSISNSDVPSEDVLSYFIKEVWYFDQRTSTYGSVITALCPVLHRSEDFSMDKVKIPMFWINYKDLSPYLAQSRVSVSNYNNAANSSWDDFFTAKLYKGDIYKTTNLQNRSLAQYCPTDSALVKEQNRIEAELVNFEKTLYGLDLIEKVDSTSTTKPSNKMARTSSSRKGQANIGSASTSKSSSSGGSSSGTKSSSTTKKSSSSGSKASSGKSGGSKREAAAPKASVRRERR